MPISLAYEAMLDISEIVRRWKYLDIKDDDALSEIVKIYLRYKNDTHQ